MIHYHGTPLGGQRQEAPRFLKGRHALVPYARQEDLGVVGDVCASFVFDPSAYTYWKSGGQLDVPGYIRWCEAWSCHPGLDWVLMPDIIDGTEADNDALIREWPRHLRRIGVPVWHLHESLERLVRLCTEWRTVALGSSGEWPTPGTGKWWIRMGEAMAVVCDENGRPLSRLHGLRMLDPDIFSKLPLSSADSTNAAMNSGSLDRFGMYVPPTSSQRAAVIAERIETFNSAPVWIPQAKQMELI